MFDDAQTMHKFAQAVQTQTLAHNVARSVESAKRWFRMGAATGIVLAIPAEHRVVGSTISRAVRLEAAAEIGQLVVDLPTFDALPDDLKNAYGSVDIIPGKRSERFEGRRCTLIDIPKTGYNSIDPVIYSRDKLRNETTSRADVDNPPPIAEDPCPTRNNSFRRPAKGRNARRMTATRRLAAILAADVAGYSRLIGANEASTLQAFKSIRAELFEPAIATHNGRLVKTTGDGFLVEFSSVVDALRCAIEVQRSIAERNAAVPTESRIEFRIGVNVGDIVLEDDDIFGDGVNIAARLEGLAEPGGICVSARVQEDAAGKLDLAFEDIGEQELKNIVRPVRVFRVRSDSALEAAKPTLALPAKPSVAVLPFANMSGDRDQEYFADGIAEDVITALSRYPSLFVIARNSSFTYKGRAVDVRQVGRELGVRYVLEGGVRKAANRIRVTAQLVEAETGNHIWAERYDRDLVEIFAVQDEITEAVIIAITPAIANAEQRRALRKPPGSLDAWAAYQRGLWHVRRANQSDNALAQKFFQQAIDLDPTFPGGYKGLSNALLHASLDFQPHDLPAMRAVAEDLARQAVALDSTDAEALARLSNALLLRGDYGNALAEAERAVAASPNLAGAYSNLATVLIYSGRHRDGLTALDTCFRLNPRVPDSASHLNHRAAALYFCCEYCAALEPTKNVIHFYPGYPHAYRWLAATLGQLGRMDEAGEALEKAVTISPASLDLYVRQRAPWFRPEDHAHMLEGLRKAGWKG